MRHPRIPSLILASLLLAASAPGDQPARPPPPEPLALPDATDAASLYGALDELRRGQVDDDRVVTFAEREQRIADGVELSAVSLGALDAPPSAVVSVLGDVRGYPSWLTLHPSYKSVRVEGASRMSCAIGSADAPKAKRTMVYDVEVREDGARWRVVDSGTPLQAGSYLELVVSPHPTVPGASLVVHRQVGFVPDQGRMTKYLTSDDDNGTNRWWKDSNRHARRLHWAIDAAIRNPPGRDRKAAYAASYQREFRGKVPWWATP
jgi:hypothetical protein